MKTYYVCLIREVQMRYGIGAEHIRDTYWNSLEVALRCQNADVLKSKQGINSLIVVQRLDGYNSIIQLSGYTEKTGMFGYLINPDNTLERFC